MKTMLRPFLAVLALLTLAACGGPASQAPATSAAKRPVIGLVMKSLANEFFKNMEEGAIRHARERGDLELLPVVVYPFPTDLGFGHRSVQSPEPGVQSQKKRRHVGRGRWTSDSGRWTHPGHSTLATAIAAMPSSRPMKPRCSFVVALTPI